MDDVLESRSFDAEFVRHQRQIYRFVVVLLPEHDAAEEAFQQTCLALLRSRDKFDPERDFLAWAQGVARNVVKEHIRAGRRAPLELTDTLLEKLSATHAELAPALDQRLSALDQCLEKLATAERALLERAYRGGETIRAIAESLALSPKALYKRLDRIRWSLLDCVERAVAREERP